MHSLEDLKLGKLTGIQKLKLSCGLIEFPFEILDLSDTLELLDLSGNHLTTLPNDFKNLKKLKIAFFSNNDFTEFPVVLSQCPSLEMIAFKTNKISFIPEEALSPILRWLILTDNHLRSLPLSIGQCIQLQKLMLAGNALTELPSTMGNCQNLQLLRISANQLTEIPSWLFSLPKLSWLAFAGNPCSKISEKYFNLDEIPWKDIIITECVGEGASGIISKATWNNPMVKEVTIKLFKGEITSDGLPTDEMHACMAAETHPNLIRVLGKIVGHPNQKQGLVFQVISSKLQSLGNPPNFETCTRDTYLRDTIFSLKRAKQIATNIASVAIHLHERHIMHGDLYAHNILVNDTNIFLNDFGAATYYEKNHLIERQAIERLEVRAFGCLLEDLLDHIDPKEINEKVIIEFNQLKLDCMQSEVLQRPNFTSIHERLALFGH